MSGSVDLRARSTRTRMRFFMASGRAQAVAESVFRALTEGSTVAEAVRRPTRFGELVEICNGDEAAVRAVVDAFRAAGCNFLAPELDPANPMPLADAAIVDISHESLIRQWKQLSEWVEAEARARRQWRRLMDGSKTACRCKEANSPTC